MTAVMTVLGAPWWVRLVLWLGVFLEAPVTLPRPAVPPPPVAAEPEPLRVGPAGVAVWLALNQLQRTDRCRYFAMHGALLKPVEWGQA